MTTRPVAPVGGPAPEPPERSSRQVWTLGVRVLLVQVITLLALWMLQAVFASG
jgi:hypothetical protein